MTFRFLRWFWGKKKKMSKNKDSTNCRCEQVLLIDQRSSSSFFFYWRLSLDLIEVWRFFFRLFTKETFFLLLIIKVRWNLLRFCFFSNTTHGIDLTLIIVMFKTCWVLHWILFGVDESRIFATIHHSLLHFHQALLLIFLSSQYEQKQFACFLFVQRNPSLDDHINVNVFVHDMPFERFFSLVFDIQTYTLAIKTTLTLLSPSISHSFRVVWSKDLLIWVDHCLTINEHMFNPRLRKDSSVSWTSQITVLSGFHWAKYFWHSFFFFCSSLAFKCWHGSSSNRLVQRNLYTNARITHK